MSAVQAIAELDSVDREIIRRKMAACLSVEQGPQVGDFVRFADGVERRISHVWEAEWHDDCIASVQTSAGGSFYLGDGACSFSGGLYPSVKANTLELVAVIRPGSCWFFHHDHRCAGNGVDVMLPLFNEWTCSLDAPR